MDLESCWQFCWKELERAAVDKRHPMRFVVVSTCKTIKQPLATSMHHHTPEQRIVVLRKVVSKKRQLFMFSDVRTPKIQQLRANNELSWLFYHPKQLLQIRVYSKAIIHHKNDLSEQYKSRVSINTLKDYTASTPPGLPLLNPNSPQFDTTSFDDNFCVVVGNVYAVDYLQLNRQQDKRAIFRYNNVSKSWDMAWIQP